MATVTITYDGRNNIVRQLLQIFISLGCKVENVETKVSNKGISGYDETLKAISEMKEGKVVRYKNFDDFKKKMYAL